MTYLYYILVFISLLLFLIHRPFITKLDIIKYALICSTSFCTLVLSNILYALEEDPKHQKDQEEYSSYSSNKSFVISSWRGEKPYNYTQSPLYKDHVLTLVPISIFTVASTCLLTRWHFPVLYVRPASGGLKRMLANYNREALFLLYAFISSRFIYSSTDVLGMQSHLGFLVGATIIGLSWHISGIYIINRCKVITIACMLSSLFTYTLICSTNTRKNPTTNSISCYMYSILVIFVCNTLDHLDTILNSFPYLVKKDQSDWSKLQDPISIDYLISLTHVAANIHSISNMIDGGFLDDFKTAIEALGPASRSWKTMAVLFPVNLRQDLCLLYAFFRTADDLVDDTSTSDQCERNLIVIRQFLHDIFQHPSVRSLSKQHAAPQQRDDLSLPQHIDWDKYSALLPNVQALAIFRNFARISHYLCSDATSELTDAWELDLRNGPMNKEKDLLDYANLISGAFGELCTCVIMYKSGRGNWGTSTSCCKDSSILSKAKATGQCLQLVNIARDIIADSFDGRCYVPLEYMQSQNIYNSLKVHRLTSLISQGILKSYSLRILDLADQLTVDAQQGIDGLPYEVQSSIRAAFEIYMGIGTVLRKNADFPLRAKVPKLQQQWIAFRCIYGPRFSIGQKKSIQV